MGLLEGKFAIVTGAASPRGLGKATAKLFAEHGAKVAILDLDGSSAEAAATDLGDDHIGLACNVTDKRACEATLQVLLERWAHVDVLVNNAGITQPLKIMDIAPENYDAVLDVNLRGTFFLTQAVARHMASVPAPGPRSIVMVSSVSAEMASLERGEYCLSKAGLAMLTRLFALRLAPLGIAVFEVRPGVIRTPMTEAVSAKYERRIADGLVPMGRWGEPDDVAAAVASLAGGRWAFATGSVVNVDGALSIPRF